MRPEMVFILAPGPANAMIQRVAHHAPPTRIGAVDPDFELVAANMAMQVEVGDAGFDNRKMTLIVDLDDLVHPLEVDYHAAGKIRCGPAVAQVLAGRNRVEGNAEL